MWHYVARSRRDAFWCSAAIQDDRQVNGSMILLVQGFDQLAPFRQHKRRREPMPRILNRSHAHAAPQLRISHQFARSSAKFNTIVLKQIAVDIVADDLLRPGWAIK